MILTDLRAMKPDKVYLEGHNRRSHVPMNDEALRGLQAILGHVDVTAMTPDQKVVLYDVGAQSARAFLPNTEFDGIERDAEFNDRLMADFIAGKVDSKVITKRRRRRDRDAVHDIHKSMTKQRGKHSALVMGANHDFAPHYERMEESKRPEVIVVMYPRLVIASLLNGLKRVASAEDREKYIQEQLDTFSNVHLLSLFEKLGWKKKAQSS